MRILKVYLPHETPWVRDIPLLDGMRMVAVYECSNTYRCPLEYDLRLREMLKFVQGQRALSYPEIDR